MVKREKQKESMSKNNKTQTGTETYNHPGRPRYILKFPTQKEWTFMDLMKANDVETNPKSKRFGKSKLVGDVKKCTMLTLRKGLEADMYIHKAGVPLISKNRVRVNPRSEVCLIEGVTAQPDSESGLGRRALLYCLRVNKNNVNKPKKNTLKVVKASRKARVSKDINPPSVADTLDKIHAALVAPDPSPIITAVTITPEAAPVSVSDPVTETVPEPVAEIAPSVEAAPSSNLVNS